MVGSDDASFCLSCADLLEHPLSKQYTHFSNTSRHVSREQFYEVSFLLVSLFRERGNSVDDLSSERSESDGKRVKMAGRAHKEHSLSVVSQEVCGDPTRLYTAQSESRWISSLIIIRSECAPSSCHLYCNLFSESLIHRMKLKSCLPVCSNSFSHLLSMLIS